MIPRRLPIDTIMHWNGQRVTDQGRAPLEVGTEKIMNEKRMVDGTLRRYVVAEKRTWSTSWENIFSKRVFDGALGGEALRTFYQNTPGEFTLKLNYGDGSSESVLVMFSGFQYTVEKRSKGQNGDIWTLSVELVEV